MRKLLLYFFAFHLIFIGCKPNLRNEPASAGAAKTDKVVYIGDGYLGGLQDGALSARSQQYSIAALINRAFEHVSTPSLEQAFLQTNFSIGYNLKPWESDFLTASKLGDRADCKGVTSLGPKRDFLFYSNISVSVQPISHQSLNWAIPYMNTAEYINSSQSNEWPVGNLFLHRISSGVGTKSALSEVQSENASFSVIWLGMENIYRFARFGGVGVGLISPAQFEAELDNILSSTSAAQGQAVIANIPDFRSFPFYTLIKPNAANLSKNQADSINDLYHLGGGFQEINFVEGENFFLIQDAAATDGYRHMLPGEFITLGIPLDSVKCQFMGLLIEVIPDKYSLDSIEVTLLDYTISQYNQIIRQKAVQYGIALVDMHSFFKKVNQGFTANAVNISGEFVSGGFFSLDGFHPTEKGSNMLAIEFIKAINTHYGATIPQETCLDCNGVLFP
ncbi:MAG: hypothetical protein ACK4K0_04155 [Flavobacteriales bacterium]